MNDGPVEVVGDASRESPCHVIATARGAWSRFAFVRAEVLAPQLFLAEGQGICDPALAEHISPTWISHIVGRAMGRHSGELSRGRLPSPAPERRRAAHASNHRIVLWEGQKRPAMSWRFATLGGPGRPRFGRGLPQLTGDTSGGSSARSAEGAKLNKRSICVIALRLYISL